MTAPTRPPPPSITLTPAAAALAEHLHGALGERWAGLRGGKPSGAQATARRAVGRVAPIPEDLRGRRAELIVEASDVATLRRALDSDADAVAVDFDDTFSPTPANVQAAYDALAWVARSDKPLLARTRALYAIEPHLHFGRGGPGAAPQAAVAALCDLSALLSARPERPFHLYIPKLETPAEAEFWQDALLLAEAHLGLAPNTVRTCLQIETFSGLMNAGELLGALAARSYGLNAGRWDYVFSLTKHLGATRTGALPPRSGLTMEVDAMRAYAEELVSVCRQWGAEAIGGTASLAPDPANPQPALSAVQADKEREAAQGFSAAWAGLPELLEPVRRGFDHLPAGTPGVNETPGGDPQERQAALYRRLTSLPAPDPLPLAEVEDAISLALAVFTAWYEGRGVVTRLGRIEDTATAELARAQLWQWVRVRAPLGGGDRLTPERYLSLRRGLSPAAQSPTAPASPAGASPAERLAAELLDALVLAPECPDYFPRAAQELALRGV